MHGCQDTVARWRKILEKLSDQIIFFFLLVFLYLQANSANLFGILVYIFNLNVKAYGDLATVAAD